MFLSGYFKKYYSGLISTLFVTGLYKKKGIPTPLISALYCNIIFLLYFLKSFIYKAFDIARLFYNLRKILTAKR